MIVFGVVAVVIVVSVIVESPGTIEAVGLAIVFAAMIVLILRERRKARWAVNASITTTMNRYGHLFDGHDQALIEGLDAAHDEAATGSATSVARIGG
jgi:hypothetical protein